MRSANRLGPPRANLATIPPRPSVGREATGTSAASGASFAEAPLGRARPLTAVDEPHRVPSQGGDARRLEPGGATADDEHRPAGCIGDVQRPVGHGRRIVELVA